MPGRISVVMTTYQGEAYIEEQLNSIFNQTKKPDELIIYDDLSEDRTFSLLRRYQFQDDISVHIFKQDERKGYIRNYASALKMCSGDLIFLCDQDDIWREDKIELISKVMAEHPDILCVNTCFTYIDEHGTKIQKGHHGNNYGMLWHTYFGGEVVNIPFNEIIFHNISMGCTMAFRKEIKDEYLRHSSFTSAHDWELNFIAALKNGLAFFQESLIQYRIHDHNTTGNDKMKGDPHVTDVTREKNAQALLAFSTACKEYQELMKWRQKRRIKKLTKFHKKRLKLLEKGKKFQWLRLLMHYKTYRNIVSFKGMFADLLYALHK